MDIIDRARACVATRPPAIQGSGGNATTFSVACLLVWGFGLEPDQALPLMMDYSARCAPPWAEKEMARMCRNALNFAHDKPRGYMLGEGTHEMGSSRPIAIAAPSYQPPSRMTFDLDSLRTVQPPQPIDEAWLAQRSPIMMDGCDAAGFLRHAFEHEDKVLIFTKFASQGQYMWWRGQSYRLADRPDVAAVRAPLPRGGPDGVWYLSQPTTGRWETNPRAAGGPKASRRSQESIACWRHLVIEADPVDELKKNPVKLAEFERLWLGFLAALELPVKAIYTSGGKSTHALVLLPCSHKGMFDAMMKMVVPLFSKLGADPRALRAVQLTRLPVCMRGDRRQRLLYLNPSPELGVSIYNMPPVERRRA